MSRADRPSAVQRLLFSLAVSVVPLLLRLLASTWSFRVVNRRVLERHIKSGAPAIVATWHEMILPGVAFFRDRRGLIMVSRSRDGEMIARINLRMGFRNVRGSSSKGGVEALYELIEAVRAGGQAALMVDGPRGPAKEPKVGCVVAASRTGAPVVPVACRVRGALRARNWDRTLIPLPFARVVISLGEPMAVPPDCRGEELERLRVEVREALGRAEAAADRALASRIHPG